MDDPGIGRLRTTEYGRDAIHIAIAPAGQPLHPGEHIGLTDGLETAGVVETPIGIVDPYLTATVRRGEKFWLFLYPRTITSLRHEWTHPAFSASPAIAAPVVEAPGAVARRRIEAIAAELDLTYNALMSAAKLWVDDEEYTTQQGSEYWRDTFPKYADAFWHNYEIVTGTKVDKKESFFSCSC